MIKTYYKQQLLKPLESGNLQGFKEVKNILLNDIEKGNQVRIVIESGNTSGEPVRLITTGEAVERWFAGYGF